MHSSVKVSSHQIISEEKLFHCEVIFTFAHSPQFPWWTELSGGKAGVEPRQSDLALDLSDWPPPSDVLLATSGLPPLAKPSSSIWRNKITVGLTHRQSGLEGLWEVTY